MKIGIVVELWLGIRESYQAQLQIANHNFN